MGSAKNGMERGVSHSTKAVRNICAVLVSLLLTAALCDLDLPQQMPVSAAPFTSPFFINKSSLRCYRAATMRDLLSLLSTEQDATSVNPFTSRQIFSCLRFMVPFFPNQISGRIGRSLEKNGDLGEIRRREDELVWWPPQPVIQLARLAMESGGDPAAIHGVIDPAVIEVPDVQGCKENKCELTRTSYGRRFVHEDLNSYMKFLFELVASRSVEVGLNASLDRFDLFHGHLFISRSYKRLGILFHAKEYPAYDESLFPFNMGFCQKGSFVRYDSSMNLRNVLWLAPLLNEAEKMLVAPDFGHGFLFMGDKLSDELTPFQGVLVALDARPSGIIYRDLVPEYVHYARTLYEDDFGALVVDVNYLNVGHPEPDYQVFLC